MKNIFLQFALGFGLTIGAVAAQPAAPTNTVSHPPVPSATPPVANINALTPEEWQELRIARQEALKANPDLVAKTAQLSMKMRLFQDKLNAAIIKTDPKVAPVVAKFAGGHPALKPASPLPKNQ